MQSFRKVLLVVLVCESCLSYSRWSASAAAATLKGRNVQVIKPNPDSRDLTDSDARVQIKFIPRKNAEPGEKRKLRHGSNRFPKIDQIFEKLSAIDGINPKTTTEPDEDILNYDEIPTDERKDDHYYHPTVETFRKHNEVPVTSKYNAPEASNKEEDLKASGRNEDGSLITEDDEDEDYDDDDFEDDLEEEMTKQLPPPELLDEDEELISDTESTAMPDYSYYDSESQSDAGGSEHGDGKVWRVHTKHIVSNRARNNRRVKEARKAVAHSLLMEAGVCKAPLQRVVPIQNVYPDPAKIYTPQCTFLHRCGNDSGCCSTGLHCVAKVTQVVELYFYTLTMGSERKVEKLQFINHTECGCESKRSQYMEDETVPRMSFRPGPSYNHIVTREVETEAPMPLQRCHCPMEYSVYNTEGGRCECDCFLKQRECMKFKRGKEHFSYKDRQCIARGECQVPKCEFGAYNGSSGICPRRQDRSDDSSRHSRYG